MSIKQARSKTARIGYALTREDLRGILYVLKKRHGDFINLPLIPVRQSDNILMFTTSISTALSHLILQKVPRDYNNIKGIQRALKLEKIQSIIELCQYDKDFTSPNALVGNIETNRTWGVELYKETATNDIYRLKINLVAIEKRLEEAEVDNDGFVINQEHFMLGYLVDAHHRSVGFYAADKPLMEMTSTLYIQLPQKLMHKTFVYINHYQEKSSAVHTLVSRSLGGVFVPEEEVAYVIIEDLYTDERSILKNRIKMVDAAIPKYIDEDNKIMFPKSYVNSSTLHNLLIKHVLDNIPYDRLTSDDRFMIISNYFSAWSNVFPKAWLDDKQHVLVKSMGFQLMLKVFIDIYNKIQVVYGNKTITPSISQYEGILRILLGFDENNVPQALTIEDKGRIVATLPIDWNSGSFGSYSNGKGINQIVKSLKKHITLNSSEL